MRIDYTNKEGIPQNIFNAIATDHYTDSNDKPSDFSVTKLISPIQQTELMRRYVGTAKIPTRDILDNYNAWVGSILHNALEAASSNDKGIIAERRFYKKILGKTLSGKVDAIRKDTIIDYKTCRVTKIMKNDTTEWEKQANLYRLLAAEEGVEINRLVIQAMMLDWKPMEARIKKAQGYPQCPIQTIPLKVWTLAETQKYAEERITMLLDSRKKDDDQIAEIYPCSKEEQWSNFEGIKLFKQGNQKATKVFKGTLASAWKQAKTHIEENEKHQSEEYYLQESYGKRTRCEEYCSAKLACQQYKKENKTVRLKW